MCKGPAPARSPEAQRDLAPLSRSLRAGKCPGGLCPQLGARMLLPPCAAAPPAEKATARQDQTRQSCTGDGARNSRRRSRPKGIIELKAAGDLACRQIVNQFDSCGAAGAATRAAGPGRMWSIRASIYRRASMRRFARPPSRNAARSTISSCKASNSRSGSAAILQWRNWRLANAGREPSLPAAAPQYVPSFPTQLLGVGCERLREWSRSRRARETRPPTIVASTWVTVIACELFWRQLEWVLQRDTLVITDGARPHQHRHRRAASPLLEQRRSLRRPTWIDTYLIDQRRHRGHSRCMCLAPAFRASGRKVDIAP
jgi:hypothetical protein